MYVISVIFVLLVVLNNTHSIFNERAALLRMWWFLLCSLWRRAQKSRTATVFILSFSMSKVTETVIDTDRRDNT